MKETNCITRNVSAARTTGEPSDNGAGIFEQLAAPFPVEAIGWKAQAVSGERALAVAFIDARTVMERLDTVVGPENWRDNYRVHDSGNVLCGLSIRVGD